MYYFYRAHIFLLLFDVVFLCTRLVKRPVFFAVFLVNRTNSRKQRSQASQMSEGTYVENHLKVDGATLVY